MRPMNSRVPARIARLLVWASLGMLLFPAISPGRAGELTFGACLADGAQAARHGDVRGALQSYAAGRTLAGAGVTNLSRLTQAYCDLMRAAPAPETQKVIARQALDCAESAMAAAPGNALAHVCVAIACAKNFPFAGNRAKVVFSRRIQEEATRAIALDPRQDIAYYLLGRWNFGVANLNFIYRGLVRLIYGGLPPASNAEAVKDLRQAVWLNPVRIIHHAELARVYAAIGQTRAARHEWQTCVKLKPLDADDAEAQAEAAHELAGPGSGE